MGLGMNSSVGPGVQVGGKTKPFVAATSKMPEGIAMGAGRFARSGKNKNTIIHKKITKQIKLASSTHCSALNFAGFFCNDSSS